MDIVAAIFAYLSVLAFTCLDALLGYLTNGLDIPVYQVILLRTASILRSPARWARHDQTDGTSDCRARHLRILPPVRRYTTPQPSAST